jgi:hypothetical protein
MVTTQIHLRVSPEEVEVLDAICGTVLKRQVVANMLFAAAIDAVKENGGRFHFPLALRIVDAPPPPGDAQKKK